MSPEHLIGQQTELFRAHGHQNHARVPEVAQRYSLIEPQHPPELDHRHELIADSETGVLRHHLEGLRTSLGAHHRIQRDGDQLLGEAGHQHLSDGQGKRQPELDGGPSPETGIDGDAALQLGDGIPHDVHAHAPAGEVGHGFGRGKAGPKAQLVGAGVAQVVGLGRGQQAPLHGFGAQFCRIHAPTVIADATRI